MAKKVITLGEIMLRLAPEGYYRFVQADTFGATLWWRRGKCSSINGKLWLRCKICYKASGS